MHESVPSLKLLSQRQREGYSVIFNYSTEAEIELLCPE